MLQAYATDSVTWVMGGGTDEWGTPQQPVRVGAKARVKMGARKVTNFAGDEVVSDGHLLVMFEPGHEDKFDVGDGVDRKIVAIHPVKAFTVSHYKVFLG